MLCQDLSKRYASRNWSIFFYFVCIFYIHKQYNIIKRGVNYGDNKRINIAPKKGYKIGDVIIDGISVGPVNTYLFKKISSNHTVYVKFEEDSSYKLEGDWYYDNVEFDTNSSSTDPDIKNGTVRIVSAETIVPTLYRYYKENFCVKIYGERENKSIENSVKYFDF